jgi:AcrR family transcriptional regulator
MGGLAEIHVDKGLPRGRARRPPREIEQAQRERLLRAVVAAVAELGYANVRIADVVERARVSRQTFYAQFADKEASFLAAHARGVEQIVDELAPWVANVDPSDPRAPVRGAVRTYFELAAREPEFTRCMLIELQAIGPRGLAARLAAHRRIAALIEAWHAAARAAHPGWPAVPVERYAAAVGAVHDLLFDAVADPAVPDPRGRADAAAGAVLALLDVPYA